MGWLGTWAKRIKLTIDAGDIDADLANFPILVYISAISGINGEDISCVFDELTSDDNRLKIAVTTSDGTTECKVEIEKWDDANEKAWLWVKVPSVTDVGNTDLYLYYDDTQPDNTTNVGDPESTPAMAVWDANFKMVQHLRDKTTSTTADSTTNNNDGTKTSANNPIVTTSGKISDAQDFSDDYIDLAAGARLVTTSAFTVEFWFNADSTVEGSLISQRLTNGFFNYLFRWSNTAYKMGFYVARILLNSGLLNTGEWYHIAMVYDGATTTTCYVNGASVGTITGTPDYANTSGVRLGQDAGNAGTPFDGKIDETRLSTVVRLISWVKATYESGRDHLLDWGTEESLHEIYNAFVTITEIIGCVDSKSRSKTIFRAITESLGALDSKSRIKSYFRTITESLGLKDTRSRSKTINRIVTELLGLKDSRSRIKSIHRIITEKLGLKETKSRVKNINRTITELLGLKDNKSRKKIINRVITELIGVKDVVMKVAWHWSLPPIPPVITAAVGKVFKEIEVLTRIKIPITFSKKYTLLTFLSDLSFIQLQEILGIKSDYIKALMLNLFQIDMPVSYNKIDEKIIKLTSSLIHHKNEKLLQVLINLITLKEIMEFLNEED